jgi:hypothetical protein
VFERLLLKVDAGEQNRYNSHFRWFIKKVEEALEQVVLRIEKAAVFQDGIEV